MAINASALIASTSGEPTDIYLSPDVKCGVQCLELPRHRELNGSACRGRASAGVITPHTGKTLRSNAAIDRPLPADTFLDAEQKWPL